VDECQGIEAQCDIVEMIGEVVRLKKDLPLLWLIASRPEPHLQYIFSRVDFSIECNKKVLLIDADTRDDVNRYLRDSFDDIRTKFPLVVDITWPSEVQLQRLEDIASGLFGLAATIVRYVSDVAYSDPVGRFVNFLAFMSDADHITTTNPLQTLDLLYSQILSQIPEDVYPTTKRILSLHCIKHFSDFPPEFGCNFLHMDKHEFYEAVRKLHSLFDIPSPLVEGNVRVHHTSFSDYLESEFRSGRFHISLHYAVNDYFKACLFWYKSMLDDPRWISDGMSMTNVHCCFNCRLPDDQTRSR
jgi:hypothetical protein